MSEPATQPQPRELVPINAEHRPTPPQPHVPAMISPLVDAAAAKQAIQQYEELKAAIAIESDFVRDSKGRTYLKKSFWRRIARCFGLSVEIVREERTVEADGTIRYTVTARATAPNGQSMDGDGLCTSREFGPTEHNVRAKACTRARNRAISDLVGGGEVSADELPMRDELSGRGRPGPARPTRQPGPSTSEKVTWGSLRKRAVAVGIATQGEWEDTVCQVTGKNDAKAMNARDLAKVETYLVEMEQRTRRTRRTAPEVPEVVDGSLVESDDVAGVVAGDVAGEYNLEDLDVPEIVP